ncbi:MAG TPA: hypothetical protein DCM02_07105 [Flavobacterium sp.]|nr:hypothetical protein [Flavobacterium sp.]
MTTITINKRTKAGKTLLELARLLAISNKGVTIDENEVDFEEKNRNIDEIAFLKNLQQIGNDCREIKKGTNQTKYRSLKSVLDEL